MPPAGVIAAGDHVFLQLRELQDSKLVVIGAQPVKLFKALVPLGDLVGHPYGTVFELSAAGVLAPYQGDPDADGPAVEGADPAADADSAANLRTNAQLAAEGQQVLNTAEAVEELKADPTLQRVDIVQRLVDGSATFHQKTGFAQQKYIRKKQHKYLQLVVAQRPALFTLCEWAFLAHPKHVAGIRPDTLGQLLQFGNVHAGARLAVVDNGSCLLPSVLLRMGDLPDCPPPEHGGPAVLHFAAAPARSFPLVAPLGLDALCKRRVLPCAFADLAPFAEGAAEAGAPATAAGAVLAGGLDSLIVGPTDHEPLEVVRALWPCLNPSAPLVVYASALRELEEIRTWLKAPREQAINVVIAENWMREYQVLPRRTHPHVTMHSCGGYLLRATKVLQAPPAKRVRPDA